MVGHPGPIKRGKCVDFDSTSCSLAGSLGSRLPAGPLSGHSSGIRRCFNMTYYSDPTDLEPDQSILRGQTHSILLGCRAGPNKRSDSWRNRIAIRNVKSNPLKPTRGAFGISKDSLAKIPVVPQIVPSGAWQRLCANRISHGRCCPERFRLAEP